MLLNGVEIINLTPHAVNLILSTGTLTIPSEGLTRCSQQDVLVGNIAGIDITETSYGEVQGLTEPRENTYYIVSRLVLNACRDRNYLLVPNQLERNEAGHIVGARSLARN